MRNKKFLQRVKNFFCRENGPTTVEYAVMLMMIALTIITALQILGPSAAQSYNTTANSMSEVLEARGN